MIQYTCDRCNVLLGSPSDAYTASAVSIAMAKLGMTLLLPRRNGDASGYAFVQTHLCEPCVKDLAVWRATPKLVELAPKGNP